MSFPLFCIFGEWGTNCPLGSGLFFQGCLYSKHPWHMEIVAPFGAKGRQLCLQPIIKDSGSPFLSLLASLLLPISTVEFPRVPYLAPCNSYKITFSHTHDLKVHLNIHDSQTSVFSPNSNSESQTHTNARWTNLRSHLSQTDQTLDFPLYICFPSWNSLPLWISPPPLSPLSQMSGARFTLFLPPAWVTSILPPKDLLDPGLLHQLLPVQTFIISH